jgi:multidrug resistance efflux pump
MANEPLPPIPTPLNQWWREFRIQIIPVVFFIVVILCVIFMWKDYVQPTSVVGQVEAIQSSVASLQDGIVTSLAVDRFDSVTEGQVVGEIMRADPEMITASLAAIQADLQVLRARMSVDEERRKFDFQQLRVDMMKEKVDFAQAKANLVQAKNDYKRVKELFDQNIENASNLDAALAERDSLQAEVDQREALIQNLESTLILMDKPDPEAGTDPIDQAIKAKEDELSATLKPMPLTSPRAGVVSAVWKRNGEKALRGEPILTISSTEGEHIIAYLRQPVTKVPAVHDKVEVHTRSRNRVHGEAQVLMVGAQMEPINPVLLSMDSNYVELGLPILISLPPGLQVRPGEPVDLHIDFSTE